MPSLSDDQLLRLYEIETRQVHSSLNHILRIRGMMAVAFAALLSATLIYRQGVIALGSLIFLAAWYYEYIYARYLGVYIARVGQLQLWLANVTQNVGDLSQNMRGATTTGRLLGSSSGRRLVGSSTGSFSE